tara:strand:- start:733 stop:996 length:264 start_codon:yes stop_codon:yes gene_type:complete
MNGRKSKQIRKKARQLVVDWLQTMLVDKEKKKLSIDNFENYLPEQTHVYMNKTFRISAYTPRWFAQRIKKSNKRVKDITWQDIENLE